jgi:putative acetyltransferase
MIRKLEETNLDAVMQIWLDTNIKTHDFISAEYWSGNYEMVRSLLPEAEVYVYEDDATEEIVGFIGLMDTFVAGLFVKDGMQSKGIGKQLLDYAKDKKERLSLTVYQKNERAVHFYQREQFVVADEQVDENTNATEYVMAWDK